jgi:hypothetical protein
MTAIQTLRAKAKAAGNLKLGSQITVAQKSLQVIVIQPTNPQIVYAQQEDPSGVQQDRYQWCGLAYFPAYRGTILAEMGQHSAPSGTTYDTATCRYQQVLAGDVKG